MASFGKVLDLFDDRYLNIQDVFGNVEPLPTLVPYDKYTQNVLVYRMDTDRDIFMALIQDFTDRAAREIGKEIWTWCVQWNVEEQDPNHLSVTSHSPKRPRLDLDLPEASSNPPAPQRRPYALNIIEKRLIAPALMQEEDMLRILIDIVQINSSLVPNFVEFLYRWIDFYEGDGTALKAALYHEIPSLWDFEYHPLVLPADLIKKTNLDRPLGAEANKDSDKDEVDSKMPNTREAEGPAQGPFTKNTREKPDIAAMERHTEESERLQYREVKFGMQPPKLSEPIPPLINVPRDQHKRTKYYTACFRSRQRALALLIEAGISISQINSYTRNQKEHPRDTPLKGEGNGLRHYQKDAEYAQERYGEVEKEMAQRDKNMEITISNRLAAEAQLAAHTAQPGGSSGVPLIPPTPPYERKPDLAAAMMKRIYAGRRWGETRINVVPGPLVGMMKSKLFEGAKDRRAYETLGMSHIQPRNGLPLPRFPTRPEDSGPHHDGDEDSDSDDDSQAPRNDRSLRRRRTQHAESESDHDGEEDLDSDDDSQDWPDAPGFTLSSMADLPRPSNSISRLMGESSPDDNRRLEMAAQRTVAQIIGLFPQYADYYNLVVNHPEMFPAPPATPSEAVSRLEFASPEPPGPVEVVRQTPARPSLAVPPLPHIPPRVSPAATGSGTTANPSQLPTLPALPPLPRAATTMVSYPIPQIDPALYTHRAGDGTFANLRNPPQMPQLPPFPIAPGLSNITAPPAFAQRLAAMQRALFPNGPNLPPSTSMASQPSAIAHGLQAPSSSTTNTPATQRPQPQLHIPPLPASTSMASQPSSIALSPQDPSSSTTNTPAIQRPQVQLHLPPLPTLTPSSSTTTPSTQRPQPQLQLPPLPTLPARGPGLTPPLPGIQRNVPPLNLAPFTRIPLTSLAPNLLATSPFQKPSLGMPIQIYFPKIVVPGTMLGPGGAKLGDGGVTQTDAMLVGYAQPGSGKIVLSSAFFLPVGVWKNMLRRVTKGAYHVLETYAGPEAQSKLDPSTLLGSQYGKGSGMGPHDAAKEMDDTTIPHRTAYSKLAQAYAIMTTAKNREEELTKRWRATKGLMMRYDRGAVWEGWAATLDRGIEMTAKDRIGAFVDRWLIDEGTDNKPLRTEEDYEMERRRKEVEEELEAWENGDYDEDDYDDEDEVMGYGL
ncbi:hypothetical protein N0V83_008876 [Neocucurbitaria cava]|uniref:Uncharacterized protein n=1 Tax=Neocucurbitaria cava TaxID=798079 RepID=A0A9W8Y1B7_9PLEO|nr:hypothetical protein N0V83_008876 [Neocucurbitaria cava]